MGINIRYALDSDADGIRSLWNVCFPADVSYGRLFFRERYHPENTLVIEDTGKVIGMLQMLPFALAVPGGVKIPSAYIYGVGVHPKYRNQGFAAGIIDQAFFEMHLRSQHIAILIPQSEALFTYYRRFGFRPVFNLSERVIQSPDMCKGYSFTAATSDHIHAMNTIYGNAMTDRIHISRDEECWRFLLKENVIGVLTDAGGSVLGYSAYSGRGQITEAYALSDAAADLVISHTLKKHSRRFGTLLVPGDGLKLGCARIVNARQVFKVFPSVLEKSPIRVFDGMCRWNSGTFSLSESGVFFDADYDGSGAEMVDADTLSELVLTNSPYINLMHN